MSVGIHSACALNVSLRMHLEAEVCSFPLGGLVNMPQQTRKRAHVDFSCGLFLMHFKANTKLSKPGVKPSGTSFSTTAISEHANLSVKSENPSGVCALENCRKGRKVALGYLSFPPRLPFQSP